MAKYDHESDWEKLKQGRREEANYDELCRIGSGQDARQYPVHLRLSERQARLFSHVAGEWRAPLDAPAV